MQNDGFTVGMLVAYQMFAGRLSQPMLRLVGLWQEFQQAAIAVKRLGDVMNAPAEPSRCSPRARQSATAWTSRCRTSRSATPTTCRTSTRSLNLRLRPARASRSWGRRAAARARSRSSCRVSTCRPTAASSIGGRDTRTLAANELRASFGVVPQETVLFSGTIYDNLVARQPARGLRAGDPGLQDGRDPRGDRAPAGGLPDGDRRARRGALRRPEAAHRDRARAAQAAARPDLRRSDQRASTRRPRKRSRAPSTSSKGG